MRGGGVYNKTKQPETKKHKKNRESYYIQLKKKSIPEY